jgi:HD-GYP domain-containing protein (c-di-GMP phosphodiesterase class II)
MNYQEDSILDLKAPFAISDRGGDELLAEGSHLDEAAIEAIAARGRQKQHETVELLQYGNIRSDLESFMSVEPYVFIFGDSSNIRKYLEQVGEIPIPLPILSALDNFRKHDFYTYRHSLVVFALTSFLMEKSFSSKNLGSSTLLVGPTHDLGKWSVPREILNKKTPLTRSERNLLEFHPISGYVLLSYYLGDHNHPAAQVALNHHERRNGTGYPRGLLDVDLLIEMVATCDVYDALTSTRPYRSGNYDNRSALEELCNLVESGALDVNCVKALIGRNRAGHPASDQVEISSEKRGSAPAKSCYALIADE